MPLFCFNKICLQNIFLNWDIELNYTIFFFESIVVKFTSFLSANPKTQTVNSCACLKCNVYFENKLISPDSKINLFNELHPSHCTKWRMIKRKFQNKYYFRNITLNKHWWRTYLFCRHFEWWKSVPGNHFRFGGKLKNNILLKTFEYKKWCCKYLFYIYWGRFLHFEFKIINMNIKFAYSAEVSEFSRVSIYLYFVSIHNFVLFSCPLCQIDECLQNSHAKYSSNWG